MLRIYLCFLCAVFFSGSSVAGAFTQDEETRLKAEMSEYNGTKLDFAIMHATQDIAKNMDFILKIRKETDAATALGWMISVSDKLPSQPVAVIQVITRSGVIIQQMCPRIVIEDMIPEWQRVEWMKQAEIALQGFVMPNPQEEAVRQKCLAAIQAILAKKQQ